MTRASRCCLPASVVLALSLAGSSRPNVAAQDGPIRVTCKFDAPVVARSKDFDRMAVRGLPSWGEPGAPLLPRRFVRVLLPPGAVVEGVEVRTSTLERLGGGFRLAPAGAEHAPIDGKVPAGAEPNPAVYESTGPYPGRSWQYHGVGRKHGRTMALFTLCPVSYFPAGGEVFFARSMEVEVAWRASPRPARMARALEAEVAMEVDNPDAAGEGDRGTGGGSGGVSDEVAYAIITSASLAPAFEPLAAARTSGGLVARIFTMESIYAGYDGGRPDGGVDDATRVRNLIIDLYTNRGLRYVLLGGDADGEAACAECGPVVVPARLMQTDALFPSTIPADMYFGCLDGTFDGDADGVYGEPNDGVGGGDVDFFFEVHVGRAPVDSLEEAQNFVRKTLAYEASSGPVLRAVLFVGEHLGFGGEYDWGGNLNDQILTGSDRFIPTVGFLSSPYAEFFELRTLYDRDWTGRDWPPRQLIDALESGVHIVNHVGHADISNVMKLKNADIDLLRGESYFLGYTQSCYAGAFDNQRTNGEYGSDSVVEHLLTGPSGAAAFIANSRRGWAGTGSADGPSQRFNRLFWDAVFRHGVLQWGAANDRSKEENFSYIVSNLRARWCAYELNTLGDPALTMKFASQRGAVVLDRAFYGTGDSVGITLIDSGLNASSDERDRATVQVRSLLAGDQESVEVFETSLSSGVFRGGVTVVEGLAAPGGTVQVKPPDTILCIYDDADAGGGLPGSAQASARVTAPLRLAGACPPDGAIGVPYGAKLSAEGGLPPYRFQSEVGYVEELGAPSFEGLGVPQGWSTDEGAWRYALPFELPFYGKHYASVLVSANGYLELGGGNGLDFLNSVDQLIKSTRIAPMWGDLVTTGGDIYVNEKLDSVTFRWLGTGYHTQDGIFVEAELFSDGTIRFGYGNGNEGVSPTIGISAGDGERYVISELSGVENLRDAPAVFFFPTRLPDGLVVDPQTGDVTGRTLEVASNEVSFAVEDSLGQLARKRCFLTIRPNGFAIESPRAGDLWLKGTEQVIRWQWFGIVGSRVRLDYNTTGSSTAFPSTISASVPLSARSFTWTLPTADSQATRIHLSSVEKPELFTVSEVFSIVGPTIILVSPRGGERWVTGAKTDVRWDRIGDTGARVQIRYNTTGEGGERDRFPRILSPDAPSTGSFEAIVPATPSETCRLLVESLADPSVRAVSPGLFSIHAPSIAIISPEAGDCLRTGEKTTVTWSSEGDTGPAVLLELSAMGGAGPWLPIGGGPLPNTGSAEWLAPEEPSAEALLRIRSAADPLISDVTGGPFSIEPRCGLRVVAWVPYIDAAEQQALGVRQAFERLDPDASVTLSTTTTPGALRVELEDKDAFVVVKQKQGYGVDFLSLGQRLAGVVAEFLEDGGAVVACEQVPESEAFVRALGLMDFELSGEGNRLCESARPLHPILAGVRSNFSGPINTAWYSVSGPGVERLVTVSFEDAGERTVVAARDLGFGRFAFLGFDYFNHNEATDRILVNAARVPFLRDGVRWIEPFSGTAFLEGAEIPIRWVAHGEAQGPVLLSYNLTGAGASFPLRIAEVASDEGRGSYAWTAPPVPGDVSHLTLRLEAKAAGAPQHADVLRGVVFVTRPLAIETASVPGASVGIPYRAELKARGGVPPYEFQVLGLPVGLIVQDTGAGSAEIAGTPQAVCPACEASITVIDSTGLSVQRALQLPVFLREITLVRPTGGELWLFGSTQEVQWKSTGDVGLTVSLHFNTDGSTTDFPEVIAESVPTGESFLWSLPPVTASLCRLKVQSNESPELFSITRRSFSIVGPTIRLDVPNGGECWEPGKRKTIQWRSAGNPGGTVRIEYGLAGEAGELPYVVAEEAPDTGEYVWTVTEPLSDDARARVSFNNAPAIYDVSDDSFRIHPACRLSGLLWSPCSGTEQQAEVIQSAVREHEPDWTAEILETSEAGQLAGAVSNKDVLIVPLRSVCSTLSYFDLAKRVKPALEELVRGGGVVVFVGTHPGSSILLAGLGLIDGTLAAAMLPGQLPCEVASVLHPITRGVPLRFDGSLATIPYRRLGDGFETLVTSKGFPVVASRDDGAGRWVILGFDLTESNAASGLLLANAARMRPVKPGLRVLSPEGGTVYTAGETISIEWAARGERSGLVRIAYNTDGSTDQFPEVVAEVPGDAAGGKLDWTAPVPLPGKHFTTRLEVRWVDPPELTARSEAPFYVVREPLSIVTDRLEDGFHRAEYFSEVRVLGGAPPYFFEAVGLPAGLALPSPDPGSQASGIEGRPLETGSDRIVLLRVRDFLGSEASRSFRMNVFPSRIEILSPAGGEYLLAGAPFDVRWRIHGYAGEAFRIDYNLNGSSRDFPEMAAEAVPAEAPFTWNVPDADSAMCRIRITSTAGLSAASERTFAISPPRITCLSPNGSEALETETLRTIRWRSLGNAGSRVRIDLSLSGSLEVFDGSARAIAADAPDTGSFEWTVPATVSETCRLRVRSASDPRLADFSDDAFAIRHRTPVRGLIWIPYTGFGAAEVRGAVAAATLFENDFDWVLSKALTPEALESELTGKEAFVMVQQEPSGDVNFKSPGRVLGPVLERFAERGGTIVVLKQTRNARELLPSTGLLHPIEAGRGFDVPCRVVLSEHPVVNQVPLAFSSAAATAWYDVPDDGIDVYVVAPDGHPVVFGRDLGDGRVVLIGFDYRDYTDASARVLANAVRMTRAAKRPRFVRGDANADSRVDIADAVFILFYLYHGGRAPPCLDAADVDDSSEPGLLRAPISLSDAVYLLRWLFSGGPAPPSPAPRWTPPQTCGPDRQFRDGLGCEEYPLCSE